MSRQIQPNSRTINATLSLVTATACGVEPAGHIGRAAFQAELAPTSPDTRAQAAAGTRASARLATGTVLKALRGGD